MGEIEWMMLELQGTPRNTSVVLRLVIQKAITLIPLFTLYSLLSYGWE
jgi:hypothetical protein